MAITAATRGSGNEQTSDTSVAFSPDANFASGSWAVLVVAVDNAETDGVAHTTFTVTDSNGNTWTRRISPLFDNGAANQGVEGAIFTTAMDGGTLTTGSTITITLGVNTTAKAAVLYEIIPDGGSTLSYVAGDVNTGATTNAPTVTTNSITSGNILIAGLFVEYGAVTITGDGDSDNGSWSAKHGVASSGAVGATGVTVSSQYKVVTGTATQTYNPTQSVSADVILGWIELTQTAGGGGSTQVNSCLLLGVG